MSLGIDMSKLFTEMTMATHTKDLVQKKMVYLYLSTYAEQNPDLAIMGINTLLKDGRDQDPMVRGLALRSLCSLRLPNITEYVLQPLRQRLNDNSSYVRKTAVIGVAKLFSRHPEAVRGSDLVDVLYNMLRDKDASVVANVIQSLNEILVDEGGMVVNTQIVMHLLNRLAEFNEWHQCVVLDAVARYKPASEDEMFDIMNVLEDRLQHANAAVVLAATKVFLHITEDEEEVHLQVLERLRAPLLTLMATGTPELSYVVLSHIKLLTDRSQGVFDQSFKDFFCRYNDPSSVKLLKLDILKTLANPSNFAEIITELSEYITDVDAEVVRVSVQGIAFIALKLAEAVDESIDALLSFIDYNIDYVTAETAKVMRNILRKYPNRYDEVIPALQKCLKTIEEEDGKVAVIWMIGEYGDTIRDAPYILETLIENFAEEPARSVRLELLSAAMKLFFKRPPELQQMLGHLLQQAIGQTSQVDVRNRALFYYRLLRFDVHEAARIVNSEKVVVDSFLDEIDRELKETIFREFNSLSVVYNKPAETFVTGVTFEDEEEEEEEETTAPAAAAAAAAPAPAAYSAAPTNGNQAAAPVVDLLDFDMPDLSTPAPAAAPVGFALQPNPVVDVAVFQAEWGQLPGTQVQFSVANGAALTQTAEASLAANHVNTMASGGAGNLTKLYLYAQASGTGVLFLVELLIASDTGAVSMTLKSKDAQNINNVAEIIKSSLL